MRMNLNQQSNGPAWTWHKNLMDIADPDRRLRRPLRRRHVPADRREARARARHRRAALGAMPAKHNYGHLQVTFDDGSVGWYEAGWGPMMSEDGLLREGRGRPEGRVSIVPERSERKDSRRRLGLRRHRKPHQDRRHPHPPRRGRRGQELHQPGRVHLHGGRARPPGTVRPRAGILPPGDPRGSRPDRVDGRLRSTACASCWRPSRAFTRSARSNWTDGSRI